MNTKRVAVMIPCYNEEKGLKKMLSSFDASVLAKKGYDVEFFVVDNGSTDKTVEVATSFGATVIDAPGRGKGTAVKIGFEKIPKSFDFIVMLDGDGTYQLSELPRMIEPIESKFCHVIVGSRLSGKMKKSSLRFMNRVGNWFFTFLVRSYYLANITDVLSGYFAFKREVVTLLTPHLHSTGFAIEMEIIAKCEKLGFDLYSVPITYAPREGVSKLNGLRDGYAIFAMFFRTLHWTPNNELRESARVLTL